MKNPDLMSKTIYYQLAGLFDITAIYTHNNRLIFRARPRIETSEAIRTMKKKLAASGFSAVVREDIDGILITIDEDSRKIPWLNIVLLGATLATMFFAPLIWGFDFDFITHPGKIVEFLNEPGVIRERIEFTAALISILLFHEFGHYLAGRRRGVLMSLPYFLPAPNIAGTFGAVIKSRSPITNRRDLIEVGATGPIAGFVVSVLVLAIGFYNSGLIYVPSPEGLGIGDSLLTRFLAWAIYGPIPENYYIQLTPAIFAGWVGLLVTMLNLLPLGQLDGGHIIYGLFGRRQHQFSKLFFAALILMGIWWPGWWFFGVLVFLFGIKHPPTINDEMVLPRHARIMGYAAIFIFIISFIPVPFSFS
nr:site-2 protease family protein [candidate division Zixibacteria bacterium]